jgi:hypothetical protein
MMSPGWEALIDDDYDSVFPVPHSNRFGIHYIATPIFLQQLGAFSPDKPVSESLSEFLEYIPSFYRLIDLCVGQSINYQGYKVTEKVNFELDLSKTYEKISEGFSQHCKSNIQTSWKRKPVIISDIKPDEIIELFIRNKGKEIKGIKPRDYHRLKNLMNFCVKNNKGRLLGVRADKKLIYGVFIVETDGRKTLLFVVNTIQSHERKIGYYVVNELIRVYSSTKTILDFAGSSIPSIASFMESFGCSTVAYFRIYSNRLFWPVCMMK